MVKTKIKKTKKKEEKPKIEEVASDYDPDLPSNKQRHLR